jgi:hypothetical protein
MATKTLLEMDERINEHWDAIWDARGRCSEYRRRESMGVSTVTGSRHKYVQMRCGVDVAL